MLCRYCNGAVEAYAGMEVLPGRVDLSGKAYLRCAACDAYCPLDDAGNPVGVLADPRLRRLRIAAHDTFDPVWQARMLSREEAYRWLAAWMGLERDECHFRYFDEAQCHLAIAICGKRRCAVCSRPAWPPEVMDLCCGRPKCRRELYWMNNEKVVRAVRTKGRGRRGEEHEILEAGDRGAQGLGHANGKAGGHGRPCGDDVHHQTHSP